MKSRPAPTESGLAVARCRTARPLAFLALALVAPLASGCGVSLLGHRGKSLDRAMAPAAIREPAAADALRERAALESAEPFWPYRLAEQLVAADSLAAAEAALDQALARDPLHWPSLALRSKLRFESGRHEEAITMLHAARERAVAAGREVPDDLLAGLALHYDALDDLEGARATLAGAGQDASSPRVYLTLRGEEPQAATRLATEAARQAPESAVNQNNLGIARLRASDPNGARQAFFRAIQLDPDLPGPYYNLAILEKFYMQDEEAAANWFDRYWQRSQDDPDHLLELFRADGPKTAQKE